MKITIQNVLVFVVVSYAIVLAPFLDAGFRNYLVLLAAFAGAFSLFVFHVQVAHVQLWSLVVIGYMCLVALANSGLPGLGSVALTFAYLMGQFTVASIAKRSWFDARFAATLLGRIVIAYAIVSVLQMIASFTGLSVPNLIASKGLWSYNSLAYEPSHLGRAIGITMLAYLIVVRGESGGRLSFRSGSMNRKVLIAFFVTMLLSGSAVAAIAIPIALIFALRPRWSVPLMVITFLVWPSLTYIDYEPLQRAIRLISNLDTLDIERLAEADGSGAARLIPFLIYLDLADPWTWTFWFGYGAQGAASVFVDRVKGIADYEGGVSFLPGFLVTYGLVGSAFFLWVLLISAWNSTTFPIIVFWFVFFTSVPWNIQLFWYGLIVLILVNEAISKRNRYLLGGERRDLKRRPNWVRLKIDPVSDSRGTRKR
ncbi:hypothetical protein [Mesorhizobium australicum]|uniref:O-antigen ligase like membrane protein n=1 Tax=Mesorhizobium australicum TaxID=536018 RepID=A0A1X7NSP4_9HYPH|nr:hypothetical protein [Mesorhizobium australicum]SMH40711.1 hypothetical protein SAMN02982922_2399 [Mesorhizobium australicum]